ncbi:MAG: hypothetical protein K8T89_20445, partial [Planctomycetes bacterium]|nr:hypothetical protein [Planctomycetota bacterium]
MNSFRLRLAGALGLAFIPMPWNMFHLVLPAARAEAPAVQSPRTFSRSPVVRLPLQIDDRTRASLAEIKLFVKGPGADWVLAQAAPASVTNFDFRADKDGEYAFMFVTVDKGGRTAPSNLNSRAPHQVILIDSTAPQLSVVPLPVANRDIYLQCRMTDANPDWTSVKLEYAIGENQWRLMDQANPESPGVFRIPHASVLEGKVRASACDKAGNVAVRIIDLGDPTKTYGTVERPLVPVEPKSIPMDIVKNDLAIPNIDNQA